MSYTTRKSTDCFGFRKKLDPGTVNFIRNKSSSHDSAYLSLAWSPGRLSANVVIKYSRQRQDSTLAFWQLQGKKWTSFQIFHLIVPITLGWVIAFLDSVPGANHMVLRWTRSVSFALGIWMWPNSKSAHILRVRKEYIHQRNITKT